MLPKKHLHKRRIRNLLPKIFFLFFLFLATTGSLFAWYFWQQAHKILFITPITPSANSVAKKDQVVTPDASVQIADLLKRNDLNPTSTIPASDSAVLVTLDTGEQIMFSQKKDMTQQIASLQLIRRQLTIEGKRLIRVDFRFDNPIISY